MIKIDRTSTVYFDTNVIIYYIEYKGDIRDRAAAVIERARDVGARRMTSELAVAECLYKPYQLQNLENIGLYRAAFQSPFVDLVPLTGDLVIRAAEEGGALGLKLLDAVHYVSALEAGCDVFVTADRKFRSSQYLEVVGI